MILPLWSRFTEWAVGPYGHSDLCLGLYYNDQNLTAVHVEKQGQGYRVIPLGKIPLAVLEENDEQEESEDPQNEPLPPLASVLRAFTSDPNRCTGKSIPTLLALDAGHYYMQFHHSDFEDSLQIDQTLRFDIEEDALLDSESVFLCYQKLPTVGQGRDMVVFSAPREDLENLTTCFEQNALDCLAIEPDGVAWMHYLKSQESLSPDEPALVLGRTEENFYLLITNSQQQLLLLRCYYCAKENNISATLISELRRCLTRIPQDQQPATLWLHHDGFSDDQIKHLEENFSLPVRQLSEPDIGQAFAAGVALGWLGKKVEVDFRRDGLAPATFEHIKKKAWLGLSAVTTLLFLILLILMNLSIRRHQTTIESAQDAMLATWKQTHPGRKNPRSLSRIPSIMAGTLKELQISNQSQSSQTLAGSSSHTFYLLMEALDTLPLKFDLAIDTMRVGTNSVDLSGSVANTENQVKLDDALQKDGRFVIDKWDMGLASTNRRSFNMSLRINRFSETEPKRRTRN